MQWRTADVEVHVEGAEGLVGVGDVAVVSTRQPFMYIFP
jgi:hypothetical protein